MIANQDPTGPPGPVGSAEMNRLTIDQMKTRFPDQWLLVVDAVTNEMHEVLSGRVIWHSRDRDELHRKDLEIGPRSAAIVFTGSWPKDMEFILNGLAIDFHERWLSLERSA